jgi:hypothetical protein
MNEFGLTEKEARISIHLEKAEDLLDELMRQDVPDSGADLLASIVWRETHIRELFRTLHRELAMRVLRRNYPKGWGHVPPEDVEQD